MVTDPKLKLENQICHALYAATNALVRAYRPLLEALDLTYPQYLVMLALWEEDGVIIGRLVERTRIDAGTLTPLLKRLAGKGLITLRKSTEDSRQKVVQITPKGRSLMAPAAEVPDKLMCQINLPAQKAAQLKALAEELYSLLRED